MSTSGLVETYAVDLTLTVYAHGTGVSRLTGSRTGLAGARTSSVADRWSASTWWSMARSADQLVAAGLVGRAEPDRSPAAAGGARSSPARSTPTSTTLATQRSGQGGGHERTASAAAVARCWPGAAPGRRRADRRTRPVGGGAGTAQRTARVVDQPARPPAARSPATGDPLGDVDAARCRASAVATLTRCTHGQASMPGDGAAARRRSTAPSTSPSTACGRRRPRACGSASVDVRPVACTEPSGGRAARTRHPTTRASDGRRRWRRSRRRSSGADRPARHTAIMPLPADAGRRTAARAGGAAALGGGHRLLPRSPTRRDLAAQGDAGGSPDHGRRPRASGPARRRPSRPRRPG